MIYALEESDELRGLLGTPIDADRLPTVRALATANGSVDAALAVARDHAVKASEALGGADDLDAKVTGGLARLVDGLVTRDK